jgi:hypothetical protein
MASVVVIVSKTLQKYIIFVKTPNNLTKMMCFIGVLSKEMSIANLVIAICEIVA